MTIESFLYYLYINTPLKEKVDFLNLFKFTKFLFGSITSVVSKIFWVLIFENALGLPPSISYFFVQIIILFTSYWYHTKITFVHEMSIKNFFNYTKVVLTFKLLDYFIFIASVYILELQSIISIFVSTVVILVIRYIAMDRYIYRRN